MAQYANFFDAYMAKDRRTPAEKTWTPANVQSFANDYSSKNPTWAPDPKYGVTGITPVKFDPYGDPSYAAGATAVTNANTHAGTERDYQYGRGAQLYGVNAEGGFDPTNPYSQAAIMKKHYDDSQRGTTNSYAAQGQLYAGSLNNARATNDYNYGVSGDQLKRAASDFYHGQDLNVQNTADAGIAQLAALLGPAFANFLAGQRGT